MYQPNSEIRNHYNNISSWLENMSSKVILEKNAEAETHFRNIGITFSTNSETARERIIPFDLIPRIFTNNEIEVKKTPKMLNQRKITVPSDSIKIDQKNNKNFSKNIKLVND